MPGVINDNILNKKYLNSVLFYYSVKKIIIPNTLRNAIHGRRIFFCIVTYDLHVNNRIYKSDS